MFMFTAPSANGHVRVVGSLPAGASKKQIEQRAEREALAIGAKAGSIQVWQLCGEVRAVTGIEWNKP